MQNFHQFQLKTIQFHIRSNKEHIDQLVKRFSEQSKPSPIYISEYNDLTSKLHNLSLKEQQLKEKLRLQSIDAYNDQDPDQDISSSPVQDHNVQETQNVPISPLVTSVTMTNAGNVQAGGFYNNGDHHRLSTVQAAHIGTVSH